MCSANRATSPLLAAVVAMRWLERGIANIGFDNSTMLPRHWRWIRVALRSSSGPLRICSLPEEGTLRTLALDHCGHMSICCDISRSSSASMQTARLSGTFTWRPLMAHRRPCNCWTVLSSGTSVASGGCLGTAGPSCCWLGTTGPRGSAIGLQRRWPSSFPGCTGARCRRSCGRLHRMPRWQPPGLTCTRRCWSSPRSPTARRNSAADPATPCSGRCRRTAPAATRACRAGSARTRGERASGSAGWSGAPSMMQPSSLSWSAW
mmetsp:Transcript_121815/g.389530  ORF Transcript_121815/g.389530 Transcript_121815/m.389530 type:complete len:263 (+) Transcript_121815:791-1579(+)